MKKTYFYLVKSGELVEKPAKEIELMGMKSFLESPFVLKYWLTTKKEDVEKIKKEAAEINKKVNKIRVVEGLK